MNAVITPMPPTSDQPRPATSRNAATGVRWAMRPTSSSAITIDSPNSTMQPI